MLMAFARSEIVYVSSLEEVILHLNGQGIIPMFQKAKVVENQSHSSYFKKIVGHSYAKYALEVAAAGEHHAFMTGPPGCGKSLLAETFPSIMHPLSKEAQSEMISLYQLSGSLWEHTEMPPFGNPHHSASGVSIVGGGQYPRPGEVSLAHQGGLFLDEIAEFTSNRDISRVFYSDRCMNPCPCGYAGSNSHYCTCASKQIIAYQNKLSGPLRDRFDINLSLLPVHLKSFQTGSEETSSTKEES